MSGGTIPVGGSIIFTLSLGSTVVYTDKVPVSGNGTYTTLQGNNPGGYTLPTSVTVTGRGLGAQQGGSQLVLNGAPIAVTAWSDTSIQFTVPADDPATGVASTNLPRAVPLVVPMTGQLSISVTFKAT